MQWVDILLTPPTKLKIEMRATKPTHPASKNQRFNVLLEKVGGRDNSVNQRGES